MIGFLTEPAGPSGLVRVQARTGQDFTIPAPQNPAPQADPIQAAPPQAGTSTAGSPFSGLERGPTTTEFALGAAALVVLALDPKVVGTSQLNFALCLVLFGAALALFLRAPDRRR